MSDVSDWRIEAATRADLEALLALENRVFNAADGPLSRRALRYHLRAGHLLWVLREAGHVPLSGYILVLLHRRSARVYSLAVAPERQGHGIARRLLQAALEELRARHIPRVKLEVRTSNLAAQKLYQSCGFQLNSSRRDYYASGEHALVMIKLLSYSPYADERG